MTWEEKNTLGNVVCRSGILRCGERVEKMDDVEEGGLTLTPTDWGERCQWGMQNEIF